MHRVTCHHATDSVKVDVMHRRWSFCHLHLHLRAEFKVRIGTTSISQMLVDSHRLRFHSDRRAQSVQQQLPVTMSCPSRLQLALQETIKSDDGVEMYTGRAVRRQHLRMLRKQVRSIVFFMAMIEIIRVGAADIVYKGAHGTKARGPEDYGVRPLLY